MAVLVQANMDLQPQQTKKPSNRMCTCPACRSRSAPAAAPSGPTAQQQGLGGAPIATQPVPVNGVGQAGPFPAAAGAPAVHQQPMAQEQDPAASAAGRSGPGQAPAAGVQQADAASVGGSVVAADEPIAPPPAAVAAAAQVAAVDVAASAAPQPALRGAEGQSDKNAQPGAAAVPENPVLSAARMVAARIAGQRAPQVLHGHSLHAAFVHLCWSSLSKSSSPRYLSHLNVLLMSQGLQLVTLSGSIHLA